jgi:3-oxoacyl-[acyl-carrier-protein] synthase II
MHAALSDAGIAGEAVDLVVAHGTATRRNDVVEAEALREVFGSDCEGPALTAVKSMMGHAMGASGAIGAATAAFALESGTIPPTINLDSPDPLCSITGFSPLAEPHALDHAMVNAFAFGGHNAVLILRRA